MHETKRPYLLFLGDNEDPLAAKTATGIAHWRREWCIGQRRLPGCGADTDLPDMSYAEAAAQGAGINTSKLASAEAERFPLETAEQLALPCVDPVRTGIAPLVDALESHYA